MENYLKIVENLMDMPILAAGIEIILGLFESFFENLKVFVLT